MTLTVRTIEVPPLRPGVVECKECHDEGACKGHVDAKVACGRCMRTGAFVVAIENGKPVTRGMCFRCQGKGFHTKADRRRNRAHTRYAPVRP